MTALLAIFHPFTIGWQAPRIGSHMDAEIWRRCLGFEAEEAWALDFEAAERARIRDFNQPGFRGGITRYYGPI